MRVTDVIDPGSALPANRLVHTFGILAKRLNRTTLDRGSKVSVNSAP